MALVPEKKFFFREEGFFIVENQEIFDGIKPSYHLKQEMRYVK